MQEEKILVRLGKDTWHGFKTESLWVVQEGNFFRINNVPFYATGLSLGDVVSICENGEEKYYSNTVQSGGHSTYRVFSLNEDDLDFYMDLLKRLGCTYEKATENLYAIDVPMEADIYEVYEILKLGEKRGAWEFEEGHCGHPLKESTI